MESQELRRRVLEIFNAEEKDTYKCWFDGEECPYGRSEGKFINRPYQFCHMQKGGCPKLTGDSEILDLVKIEDQVEKQVEECIDELPRTTLAKELRVLSERLDIEEKGLVLLIAELIEERDGGTNLINLEFIIP